MDINSSLNYSKDNSNELKTFSKYKIKMKLEKGKSGEIIITNDSNPEELAYNFCLKNNLNYKYLKIITKKLNNIQKLYLLSSRSISNSMADKNSGNSKNSIKRSYKKIFFSEKTKNFNNNTNLLNENNLKKLLNKEYSVNTIKSMEDYSIDNKENKNSLNSNFFKKIEISKKNKKHSKNRQITLTKELNKYINSKEKNKKLTTNIINKTIQKCLNIIENETRPFYNEIESSQINKELKSSKLSEKSEIQFGSSITKENIDNNSNLINNDNNQIFLNNYTISQNLNNKSNKEVNNIQANEYESNSENKNNNKIEADKKKTENDISSNKTNKNCFSPERLFNIDTNISKSEIESQNITKNIIINDSNIIQNNKVNKNSINKNFVISESISVYIPSWINKEISINISPNSLIPYNKNYNYEEKYKKVFSKSNRCIPKSNHSLKKNNNIYNRSESNKNKYKKILKLFNDSSDIINIISNGNGLGSKYIRSSIIYNNLKNKTVNNKEVVCTPSTYIKSCKNSLSSLTISDKNLLSFKNNNIKNNFINKNDIIKLMDDLNSNNSDRNSNNNNIFTSIKNKLYNKYKMSKRIANSININDTIEKGELYNQNIQNNIDRLTNFKEKNKRFKLENLFKKFSLYNYKNNNKFTNNFELYKYNSNYRKKDKEKMNKNQLILDKIKIVNAFSSGISNSSSTHYDFLMNNLSNHFRGQLNKISRKKNLSHSNDNSAFFINNLLYNNSFNQSSTFSKTIKAKNKMYIGLNYLTESIISKKDIENCFEKIFNYICKNHQYFDVFRAMNTKNIPSQIYKVVKFVIKNCNKKRFITANEFIRKGTELFHFFSKNDKIAIINFNIFS